MLTKHRKVRAIFNSVIALALMLITLLATMGSASAGSLSDIQECPSSPPSTSDPQWKPYDGNSKVFHCGFTGFVENRTPTRERPAQECFYDNSGKLVDEHHACAGCRGTPNQYPASNWWDHTFNDSGGIWANGREAYSESKRCNPSQKTSSSWDSAP